MPTTLNRDAWIGLLREDKEWLLAQPRTLERDHIAGILDSLIAACKKCPECGGHKVIQFTADEDWCPDCNKAIPGT